MMGAEIAKRNWEDSMCPSHLSFFDDFPLKYPHSRTHLPSGYD